MNKPEKEVNRLPELEFQLREVDDLIDRLYSDYGSDHEIKCLKTERLHLEDEIHRIKTQANINEA